MSSWADELNRARADALKRQKTGTAKPASVKASTPAPKEPAPATAATPAPAPAAKPATTPDAPVDYASALKDQRTKLAEAEARVKDPTISLTDLMKSKERIDMLRSAVKTLEGASQRERQAKLTAAGAQPIDPAEEPFTYTNPRLVRAGPAPTGIPAEIVLLQALEDRQEDREVETSRGQLFRAGGKSPEELATAAEKVRSELDDVIREAEATRAEKQRVQSLLKEMRGSGTSLITSDVPGRTGFQTERLIREAEAKIAALESTAKNLAQRQSALQQARILTGSAAPAVVAAKAQEQREAAKAVPGPDTQEAALRRMNKEAMENISDEEIRMLGMGSGGY